MSVVSDVQDLYGTLQSTWSKGQTHVISHIVLIAIVFGLCGFSIPQFELPHLDLPKIMASPWFQLAKDTGVIYLAFVIPIILVSVYVAALQFVGQVCVMLISLIFRPAPRGSPIDELTEIQLEPLALTLNSEEFTLYDLTRKSNSLLLRFQAAKNDVWQTYQKYLSGITQSAIHYLGDFSVFLMLWLGLFHLLPSSAWTDANRFQSWKVTLLLLICMWIAWFRVSRALGAMPRLYMQAVLSIIAGDPEFAIDAIDRDRRIRVRERLRAVLKQRYQPRQNPYSVRRLARQWIGLRGPTPDPAPRQKRRRGFPFPRLYERGLDLSLWILPDPEKKDTGPPAAGDVVAYFYFRLYEWATHMLRTAWQLAKYIVTGVP
jgi:hypothetical protein